MIMRNILILLSTTFFCSTAERNTVKQPHLCELLETLPTELFDVMKNMKKEIYTGHRKLVDEEFYKKYPLYLISVNSDVLSPAKAYELTIQCRDAKGRSITLCDTVAESKTVGHEISGFCYTTVPLGALGPVTIGAKRGFFINNLFKELPSGTVQTIKKIFYFLAKKNLTTSLRMRPVEVLACAHPYKPIFASCTKGGTITVHHIKRGMIQEVVMMRQLCPFVPRTPHLWEKKNCQELLEDRTMFFGPKPWLIAFQKMTGKSFGTLHIFDYKKGKVIRHASNISSYFTFQDVRPHVLQGLDLYTRKKCALNLPLESTIAKRAFAVYDQLIAGKDVPSFSFFLSTVAHTRYHPRMMLFTVRVYYASQQYYLPIILHGIHDLQKDTWRLIAPPENEGLWEWDVPEVSEQAYIVCKNEKYPRLINSLVYDDESFTYELLCQKADFILQKWNNASIDYTKSPLFLKAASLIHDVNNKDKTASTLKLNWLSKQRYGKYIFREVHKKIQQKIEQFLADKNKTMHEDVRILLADEKLFPRIAWSRYKDGTKLIKMPYKDTLVEKNKPLFVGKYVDDAMMGGKINSDYLYMEDTQKLYKLCLPNLAFVARCKEIMRQATGQD
jgi:hypothetical protein